MCGYRGAKAVAAAERGEDGFSAYNRFWKESFEFNDPEVVKDTWKGFLFRFLHKDHVNYIISLADGLFLDGTINHFTCGNRILEFVDSQMDRIKEERPELAKKLAEFNQFKMEDNILGEV
jgi:hypothetical protein